MGSRDEWKVASNTKKKKEEKVESVQSVQPVLEVKAEPVQPALAEPVQPALAEPVQQVQQSPLGSPAAMLHPEELLRSPQMPRAEQVRQSTLGSPAAMLPLLQGGRPTYARFASVPPQNSFTASAHGHPINIGQYNNGCSGSLISAYFAQPNSVQYNSMPSYHYDRNAAAPPAAAPPASTPAAAPAAAAPAAAAPPAAGPPSSEAQQLADGKAMFEDGLIPSRELYEAKVRQILGLP